MGCDFCSPGSSPTDSQLGGAIGASLGGLFVDTIGWRWGYLTPVPLSVISILVFLLRVRPKLALIHRGRTALRLEDIDYVGSALIVSSPPARSKERCMVLTPVHRHHPSDCRD
jgi:MFS family permease